jgi:hypothetical protein
MRKCYFCEGQSSCGIKGTFAGKHASLICKKSWDGVCGGRGSGPRRKKGCRPSVAARQIAPIKLPLFALCKGILPESLHNFFPARDFSRKRKKKSHTTKYVIGDRVLVVSDLALFQSKLSNIPAVDSIFRDAFNGIKLDGAAVAAKRITRILEFCWGEFGRISAAINQLALTCSRF